MFAKLKKKIQDEGSTNGTESGKLVAGVHGAAPAAVSPSRNKNEQKGKLVLLFYILLQFLHVLGPAIK